jgi:hypothetical protein
MVGREWETRNFSFEAGTYTRSMFQLNLSTSVHGVTQLNPECVLELLKLSSDVNECKPLLRGRAVQDDPIKPGLKAH